GRGDRCPERYRTVGRDVGEGEDPEADEHPERQERQDQPDRPRPDEQRHGNPLPPPTARGTYQMTPRVNTLSPAPRIGRESPSRWRTASIRPGSNRCETIAASSTAPPGSGRYGTTAAWKWPWMSGASAPAIGRTNGDSAGTASRVATPTTRAV